MREPAELGRLVRAFRHASGLTLEDLADRSGVSVRAISDMERGRSRTPHARTLTALAAALRLGDTDRGLLLSAAWGDRPVPGPAPLCELPPDLPDFTGRAAEMATAVSLLTESRGAAIPVVISGAGGLGKTALAVHVAHLMCPEFPDGRLFVDLGGTGTEPLDSHHVQFRLLRALGLGAEDIPADYPDRGQLLRHELGGRRMLLVLDNAADEAQVRGLLPGSGATSALVTSRRALTGLEHARRIAPGPLTDSEADDMLRAVIESGGTTVTDPAPVGLVARLCGNYPLALRIAGNRVSSRPGWALAALVGQLTDEEGRLDQLTAGDLRITSAFTTSYDRLDAVTRLLFRRLALIPGAEAGPRLASVVTQLPRRDAARGLDDLIELGLLVPAAGHRARFHDLVRLFALEQLRTDDSAPAVEDATSRLMSWLLATARSAGLACRTDIETTPGPEFSDRESARRWLETESRNWLAALRHAARVGDHTAVVDTVDALCSVFPGTSAWRGWAEVFGLAAEAAGALGDTGRAGRYRRHQAELSALT